MCPMRSVAVLRLNVSNEVRMFVFVCCVSVTACVGMCVFVCCVLFVVCVCFKKIRLHEYGGESCMRFGCISNYLLALQPAALQCSAWSGSVVLLMYPVYTVHIYRDCPAVSAHSSE